MDYLKLSNLGMFIVVLLGAINGCESRNFPLDGCSTDDMDILFLYFETGFDFTYTLQKEESTLFVQDLLSFPSNKTTPRVMVADVYDRFSALDPHVNVSSWQLQASLQPQAYGVTEQQARIQGHFKLQEVIEQKVAFTQRLFSEMGGVRENVTDVAVIFLEDVGFSYEESRSVPHIVQQQGTDIKIFVVVFDFQHDILETVHLSDTLVGTYLNLPKHALIMAICNQCMEGGIMFKHNVGAHDLSCYMLLEFDKAVTSYTGGNKCYTYIYGSLATIESYEELDFLKVKLFTSFTELGNQMNDYTVSSIVSAVVYIGLGRDRYSEAKRFQWNLLQLPGYHPLVVNNWLPGKPSGGYNIECGAWQFVWDTNVNMTVTNVSGSDDIFVEGWLDVDCRAKLGLFSLCETVLPRRVDEHMFIIIKPATNESFSQVLNKEGFVKFGDNIVSISANIASLDFITFIEETKEEFPMFDCGVDAYNFRYISYLYVCDSIDHCSNRRDESFCGINLSTSQSNKEVYTNNCYGLQCCEGRCLQLRWINDGEVDCTMCDSTGGNVFNDERDVLNKYLKRNETCAFICNNDKCVHFSQLNDGVIDCTGPEGPLDETIGQLVRADTCYNILGHSIWAPRCVYVKDRFNAILGCRDVSHLKSCTDFECPEEYVQCPNTYCIPQHYVLDGKADCPTGEDELSDNIGPCTGNFACWNSKMCLYPDLVCDGHPDCPHKDDEVDCDGSCAEGFRCVSGTLTVADYNKSIPLTDASFIGPNIRYLDLSGLDLSKMREMFSYYVINIPFIKCSKCNIRRLPVIFNFNSHRIQEVDFSYNQIQEVDGRDFFYYSLNNLRNLNISYNRELSAVRSLRFKLLVTLDLSHTALSHVDESNFAGLQNLKHLDLSFTYIEQFYKNSFPPRAVLQTLDLRGVMLKQLFEDFFNGLTVSHDLYTDSFQLCCPQIRGTNIPYHTCHAPDDAISTCFDLIGVNFQRVLLWVFAVLAVLGNMTVIVYRIIWDRSVLRTGYGLFVTNLGVSDFIMGIYLFIIAGADYYYRDIYVLYDKSWRESIVCRLSGFLATLSSETSTFCIALISLDRFLVMKYPFGQIKFSQINKIIALLLSWVIGFLLALTPIVFQFEIYSSNAMCLGLPLTNKRFSGWEFSFGVFIGINVFTCLVIAYGQRAIFRAMSENRITGSESRSPHRRVEDILVAKQLSLVALSNFLCWFPISVMGLLSVGGHEISNDVYAWTTVIVLPINSAANPLLYTIPVLMAKWEKFKQGRGRSLLRST